MVGAVMTYSHPGAFECVGKMVAQPDDSFRCDEESLAAEALFYIVVCAVVSVLLLIGALLLFLRTTAGRVIVMVATALSALVGVGFFVTDTISVGLFRGPIIGLTPAVLSIVALGFAAAPSTGRWISAARSQPRYPQPNYRPY
ncbi:hypothetical protein [Nocardia coubleae]|uniref:Uncharacterized protein n=2 Tax=Nocardia coubleae TaxID=356147 RepID=A0A846WDT9_9NOCA|nr:hypothetical protein [Nocardia coubleae]NKX90717.1 hypothetical protein [Nocardia coubleae]